MEVQGYCTIRKNATTGKGCDELELFIGKDLRVMEFATDGSVLVINAEATSFAMFDKEDVLRKFKCNIFNDVVCPPDLNILEQLLYHQKVTTRKGGYNKLLRLLVIQASLAKGEFFDYILFAKQNQDEAARQ